MAHANNHQRRVVLVPNGALNPPRPVAFANPNFVPDFPRPVRVGPPVLVPVRSVLHPALLARVYLQRSLLLHQFMNEEGLVPSPEEEFRRRNVIEELKKIVAEWVKEVAYRRRLPESLVRVASATVLAYGSYDLGVHSAGSDIDALCVGPCFATLTEDFFIVLHDILANNPEVSEIHSVKEAKVPLIRFKFKGISIDLPYSQLRVTSVPKDVDILNPFFLAGIDKTSWRSLSGLRANKSILQLVPSVEVFQQLLRCVKLWAKRRGLYGNLLGFFGGVHLAVLTAFVCQRNPNTHLAALICSFFETFAFWPWPTPVLLLKGTLHPLFVSETRSFIPIELPCGPNEFCHSNITKSTFNRIIAEFRRGFSFTQDILKPHFDWRGLFEPFPYARIYPQFVKICLSSSGQAEFGNWVGWVKSRFRTLIVKFEEVHGFCDPNPMEFVDVDEANPNIIYYWCFPVRAVSSTYSPSGKTLQRVSRLGIGAHGGI